MITQSIKDFFSKFKTEEDYDYNYEEFDEVDEVEEYEEEEVPRNIFPLSKYKANKSKKIDINSVRMQIVKPSSYEEVQEVILLLKQKQSVILNLEYVSKEEARRIIDTVSGGVIALDGKIVKVTNSIFIAAPENYVIEGKDKKRKSNINFL
ncbi:MAG: cell division protein SepF [Clostridium sp.]